MKQKLLLGLLLLSITSFSQVSNISITQSFREYAAGPAHTSPEYTPNGSMLAFNRKEDTEGSPYLLKDWAKGTVFLKKITLNEPTYSLNYDKMKKKLILKLSESQVLDIDMDDIQSFNLIDSSETYSFKQLPGYPNTYVIEVYEDSMFSLYKSVETKFFRADYVNKGLYESGNKFDRYVDQFKYYIKPTEGSPISIPNTNKKELKKLSEQYPQIKGFVESNSPSSDIETYLVELTKALNKH